MGKREQGIVEFLHRKSQALKKGSIKILKTEPSLIAYARFWGEEQIVVIINNSDKLREVTVPVWQAEVSDSFSMARLMYSYEDGYIGEFEEYKVYDGNISLMMGKYSAIVVKNKRW